MIDQDCKIKMPRSVAFSGKKKKTQLQQKRNSKNEQKSGNTIKEQTVVVTVPPSLSLPTEKENRHEKFKLLFQRH